VLLPLSYLQSGGRWKGLLLVTLSAFLLAYGTFAFFAQAGGLFFVGESFEWPLVSMAGAVENARGQRFVPVIAPRRIQVYNGEDQFVSGWFIPASGGGFKLHITNDDNLEIFTVRGDRLLVFAADGTLLTEGHYRGEDYDQRPTGPDCRVDRLSAWYLWPLAHPFLALLPFAGGLGGLALLFNHPGLRAARIRRTLHPPGALVRSGEFGQLSIVVDTLHEPPGGVIDSDYLRNPPSGAWYVPGEKGFAIGASTRSPIASMLVPFTCLFAVSTLGWLYGTQIASGKFQLGTSLAGIPFVLVSIVFWTIALMAVSGKVVVTVNKNRGTVFVGIGPLGWKRFFDWSDVRVIQREGSGTDYLGADTGRILLEGTTQFRFGTNLTEKRRCFVLNALMYLKDLGIAGHSELEQRIT
jgi:hypothetical protein